jgi:hypothetical protein
MANYQSEIIGTCMERGCGVTLIVADVNGDTNMADCPRGHKTEVRTPFGQIVGRNHRSAEPPAAPRAQTVHTF